MIRRPTIAMPSFVPVQALEVFFAGAVAGHDNGAPAFMWLGTSTYPLPKDRLAASSALEMHLKGRHHNHL